MLHLISDAPDAAMRVAQILKTDGVAALPTETVYGLVALWRSSHARERIYLLKRRPPQKRLQMLAHSVDSAIAAGLLPDPRLHQLAKRFWPGALTVVAPAKNGDSIGLRIPAHPFILKLLQLLDEPLAATSANLSGMPPGLDAATAVSALAGEPDVIVDGGSVRDTGGVASTVVSLLGETPVLLRQGPVTLNEITACLCPPLP